MGINWLGAGLAFVVGMGVSMMWYSPIGFGRLWWKLTGITPEQSKQAPTGNMAQLFLTNILFATGIAATHADTAGQALLVGAVAWAGASGSTLVQHNAFELKPAKLTIINTSYQLVLFLVMSLAISLL
ncbi:DUF1761 domain-containing protein [Pseudonocardiaceae bacterium YIM PH 21723]|nr:DUF1761 domain-containing protein [Pseudonocardiaceae bacterium YIM PH 21723]